MMGNESDAAEVIIQHSTIPVFQNNFFSLLYVCKALMMTEEE